MRKRPQTIYKNRNVACVFGGSGFIGSHVVEQLLLEGYTVFNFDVKGFIPDVYYEDNDYVFHRLDICNESALQRMMGFGTRPPKVVYNFAGISSVGGCIDDPARAVYYNIIGNTNIIESIVNSKVKKVPRFVYASSMYAAGNKSGLYGITKQANEKIIEEYSKSGLEYTILRYGTVYGQRAKDDNSIKELVKHALKTKVLSYYGTGEETRNYVYVKDVAKTSVSILKDKFKNKIINVVGRENIKAKDLMVMLQEILGKEYSIEFRHEVPDNHYMVTPYNWSFDDVFTYNPKCSYDLGTGLMSVIKELKGGK